MTVQIVDEVLESSTFYTGNSVSQRDWLFIARYLVEDYGATFCQHPSSTGMVMANKAGFICKFTELSSGVVYFDAYGNSPVWVYVGLLDAVLLGEANMRKGH